MEEIYFLVHSCVDVVLVFGMMDKLCCPFHCKGDVPHFIGVGSVAADIGYAVDLDLHEKPLHRIGSIWC